ncbi:MAG: restriction endonuclease subunit S [Clostridiales bacterium]|nr:restriction endonuclease subunit S [Clostridiales bacterium]
MFEILTTSSFNTDKLVEGEEYDYVTRTSFNQGVLRKTGYVNQDNINEKGTWSLGLLQMDFFYRENPWYAGQFVRKIVPKIAIDGNSILYFTTLLNKQKQRLLNVLVRDVDTTFSNAYIQLPTKNGEIDFKFMDAYISELEEERISELAAYLKVSGLDNYELSIEEKKALETMKLIKWEEKDVTGQNGIFNVKNTKNILSNEITPNSGNIPYLCASADNNSVSSYIEHKEGLKDKGNCIFIGGKTFVISYQENDFFSNDSHNLALYLKQEDEADKVNQLFLATCLRKSLSHKYSWGNSISNKKIQNDKVMLPIKDGVVDYKAMSTIISAVKKLVIKDVVLYADNKINATKKVISKN